MLAVIGAEAVAGDIANPSVAVIEAHLIKPAALDDRPAGCSVNADVHHLVVVVVIKAPFCDLGFDFEISEFIKEESLVVITDRNLLVEATGYATANAGYNGNDNMLKAVITPLFIPGTVTGSDGNVVQRNFTFGYYRVKPYAEGTTTRGNYAYYLGFWRSSVSATDNPTEHLSSANMAYLSLTPEEYGTSELGLYDAPGNPAEAPYIHFTFDDSPVGITTIQETSTSDNGYYTLQGVKVNRPTSKGIYIHQGKKIIFK